MNFQEAILKAQDAVTVERVYGSPYERDGIVVIPAARVSGAGGGGAARTRTEAVRGVAAVSAWALAQSART